LLAALGRRSRKDGWHRELGDFKFQRDALFELALHRDATARPRGLKWEETTMAGPQVPKDFRRVIVAAAGANL